MNKDICAGEYISKETIAVNGVQINIFLISRFAACVCFHIYECEREYELNDIVANGNVAC